MAIVDMAKAFESVSHETLCMILAVKGIPNEKINVMTT